MPSTYWELIFVLQLLFISGLLFDTCQKPSNFPSTIELELIAFENWSKEIKVRDIWVAFPKSDEETVILANWAKDNDYKLRATGFRHSWSPITVASGTEPCSKTMLVDTRRHLNKLSITENSNLVTAHVGVQMDNLLQYIEDRGHGFYNIPAVGDISVGGMLAINAHGTSVPALNEKPPAGHLFGTVSNKIVNFTAVIWDSSANRYALKSFPRTASESAAFLVNLGRAFLTEVTLLTGSDYNMRCQGRTDIKASELFAESTTAKNTVSSFLDQIGRIEILWFPYTETPWILLRSLSPNKPPESREVKSPYNYLITSTVPEPIAKILQLLATVGGGLTAKSLPQTAFNIVKSEMLINGDLWGKSKNVMLYVKPTTALSSGNGLVVQTRRNNVQNVLHNVYNFYNQLLKEFNGRNIYPSIYVFSIRITSLDTPPENGWSIPGISSARPLTPESPFDIALWFDIETVANSMRQNEINEFVAAFQNFLFTTFNDENAKVTPEWAKRYAYTNSGPFTNETVLKNIIPSTFQNSWKTTVDTLNKYDPHHIFSNDLLQSFFG